MAHAEDDVLWTSEHTWVIPASPDEIPADHWENGILWTYDGQQEFHAPGPACDVLDALHAAGDHALEAEGGAASDHVAFHVDAPEWNDAETVEDLLWMRVRVDAQGRRWVVADVDVDGLQDAVDEYSAMIADHWGEEYPSYSVADALAEAVPLLVDEESVDYAWSSENCGTIFEPINVQLWGTESRSVMNDMTTSEAKAAEAAIFTYDAEDNVWFYSCSGAFIDENSVLTAAHCVWDTSQVPAGHRKVCTLGGYHANTVCYDVGDIDVSPSYSGGSVFANDYAVLNLQATTAVTDFYALSQDMEGNLDGSTARHLGGPGYWDSNGTGSYCNSNVTSSTDPYVGYTYAPLNEGGALARTYYVLWEEAEVTEYTSTVIGGHWDSGSGASGGPIYVYAANGMPVHIGLVKGYNAVPGYVGGPRTYPNRTWIISSR